MKNKQEKMTLEKLAMMINNGFLDMDNKIEEFKKQNAKEYEEMKKEIQQFKSENSKEHEEMKLRQDEVAYRFEFTSLERRVEHLEKLAKVSR